MKVYQYCPAEYGRGIKRVAAAIFRHSPEGEVSFVETPGEADLVIYHVIGVMNWGTVPLDQMIVADGKPYAIVQYGADTTETPTADYWMPIWRQARLVWSYYDLDRWCFDRCGGTFPRFYYAPLGCDAAVFKPPTQTVGKIFTVGTSGFIAETEGVRECYAAVCRGRGTMFHLGPDLNLGSRVATLLGVSDEVVARLWAECRYVAGLRRVEGFELPAVEGLFCKARPVCFDAPHYRQWFGDLADYVSEGAPAEVTQHLTALFAGPYRAVTDEEVARARQLFHWPTLVSEFWRRLHA